MNKFSTLAIVAAAVFAGSLAQAKTAPAPKKVMACFFTKTNYEGAHFCFRPGQKPPDLSAFPLSDGTKSNGRFGSIMIEGGAKAEIYDSPQYKSKYGKSMQVAASIPDLEKVWTTTLFSVSVR